MNTQGSIGLHWKLAALSVAVSLLACVGFAIGYGFGIDTELATVQALQLGAALALLVALVGAWLGFQAVRSVVTRIGEAADFAERIARGDLGARMPVQGADEVGYLEEHLNTMADQLQQAVDGLQHLAEQNRVLAEEARRGAAVEERAKLARDLHDTVNQQLFVLTMKTAASRRRLVKLEQPGLDAVVTELQEVEELAREAHGQARELILQLRPTTLEQQGLGPALAEYVRVAASKNEWHLETDINTDLRLFGPVAENLFRILQEALHNVQKHAEARTIWVSLTSADGRVVLQVRDDGKGFESSDVKPTSVGLKGIAERITGLKGSIRVRSGAGEGTELMVSLPLEIEGGADA